MLPVIFGLSGTTLTADERVFSRPASLRALFYLRAMLIIRYSFAR
jgi:hypothetical protein